MQQNKSWLKFLITGNPRDYLDYKNTIKQQQLYRGEDTAHYNRWTGDQRDEYEG